MHGKKLFHAKFYRTRLLSFFLSFFFWFLSIFVFVVSPNGFLRLITIQRWSVKCGQKTSPLRSAPPRSESWQLKDKNNPRCLLTFHKSNENNCFAFRRERGTTTRRTPPAVIQRPRPTTTTAQSCGPRERRISKAGRRNKWTPFENLRCPSSSSFPAALFRSPQHQHQHQHPGTLLYPSGQSSAGLFPNGKFLGRFPLMGAESQNNDCQVIPKCVSVLSSILSWLTTRVTSCSGALPLDCQKPWCPRPPLSISQNHAKKIITIRWISPRPRPPSPSHHRFKEGHFEFQIGLLDKLTYGSGSLDPTNHRDPFSHMNASQPFGPPPSMSMATMAALAAGMANNNVTPNGPSSPEEALALEMIRKTKGFFPGPPQSLSRPAFPGQPGQLPDVVSTLPVFPHRPDHQVHNPPPLAKQTNIRVFEISLSCRHFSAVRVSASIILTSVSPWSFPFTTSPRWTAAPTLLADLSCLVCQVNRSCRRQRVKEIIPEMDLQPPANRRRGRGRVLAPRKTEVSQSFFPTNKCLNFLLFAKPF